MYDHAWIGLIIVAMEMSSHCSIIVMFDVKNMTLESVNDSIFCLAYTLNVAPFTVPAIDEIIALACAFSDSVVGCIIVEVGYFP